MLHSFIHSFIHSGDLYSASSRLRGAPSPVTAKEGLEEDVKFGRGGNSKGFQLICKMHHFRAFWPRLKREKESVRKLSY